MNNRYTYKAKRKDNQEWVYGDLIDNKFIFDKNNNSVWDGCYYDDELGIIDGHLIKIIPETLCQCTGLQDIEGNYIFENDIVLKDNKKYIVLWWEKSFKLAFYHNEYDDDRMIGDYYCNIGECLESFKIIGNKFDEVVE